ncbi:MAG: heavy metal translocating P-type ATPase, partial [Rhodothermales bacterium]|nr:heavy metal translocating P-type ATPase [Rhodothermales bacterium]
MDDRFCCASCSAVYRMLHESGLAEDYYRLATLGSTPTPATAGSAPEQLNEFDSPVFLDRHTRTLDGGKREVSLHLEGVHCAACVWLVERMPHAVPGVSGARVDLASTRLDLRWEPGQVSLSGIAEWLGRFGYTPHPLDQREERVRAAERKSLVQVGIAWALAANVMLLAAAFYVGLDVLADPLLFTTARWTSLVLAFPAVFVIGRGFFLRAWTSARLAVQRRDWRHLHMDVPVALGLTAGFVHSTMATVTGNGEVWFDSLAVLTAALLTSRWLQQRSRRAATEAVSRLHGALPTMATVVEDGTEVQRPADMLAPGDLVRVEPGGLFPADGRVESGRSSVDRSMITGESRPEPVRPGTEVLAGARNLSSPVLCRVSAAGGASRLGGLLDLAGRPADEAPIVELANRISGPFVAVVLTLAVITAVAWTIIDPAQTLPNVIALLVITCPCALGMATPLAMTVASGRAAGAGIFIRGGLSIQRLTEADTVILDKTGTLTAGQPTLVYSEGPQEAVNLAAALEREIRHPLATAVTALATQSDLIPDSVTSVPGNGVHGIVQGQRVAAGRPEWILEDALDPQSLCDRLPAIVSQGLTPVVVAVDGQVTWIGGFGDTVRPEARDLVDFLTARGVRAWLLSGDHPEVSARVARELGLPLASPGEGGLTAAGPEAKAALVQRLQQEGRIVVMVGDGLNDAPALAGADVGIAVDAGTQSNRFAADVVITRNPLDSLMELFAGADRTMAVIRRNLGISLAYNMLAAGLAMGGL